jgi:hypothetical protein
MAAHDKHKKKNSLLAEITVRQVRREELYIAHGALQDATLCAKLARSQCARYVCVLEFYVPDVYVLEIRVLEI